VYWLAVTAFKGSGSSQFSATFQRWTMKIARKFLKRIRFTFPSILETEAYWLAVTAWDMFITILSGVSTLD